ncbi:hypothetical protein V0288_22180 [Pannus brasiliensis CCIBt3594]|uniref:Uncharacterized protein n=1 Tax=Pannus brasiliensis CCIBt3594 TaxID=1427578 RepID=A0AAW9R0N5_9CHRO
MNDSRSNSNPLGRVLVGLFNLQFWLAWQFFKGCRNFSRLLYHYLYRRPKIDRVLESDAIYLPHQDLYSIPLDVLKLEREIPDGETNPPAKQIEWKVKTIHPKITATEIQLHDITVDLQEVTLIKSDRADYDYSNTRRLAPLVKTLLFDINPKIDRLSEKRDELIRLRDLAASSELFQSRAEVYDRAIHQIQAVIDKAEYFRQECLKFIRETLIERELVKSDLDPDLVDWPLDFETKYQLIQEKYQLWKEEIQAYLELRDATTYRGSS